MTARYRPLAGVVVLGLVLVIAAPAAEPAPSAGNGPVRGRPWMVPDLGVELVWMVPVSFLMGSTDGEDEEWPRHAVGLTHEYWLGKYEVTQGEWEALMGTTVAQQRDQACWTWPLFGQGPRCPMYYVSWDEATEFCRKLTDRERAAGRLPADHVYRLPTEAEWEYAARGGEQGKEYLYSGSNTADEVAWYAENGGDLTHAVGGKKPNALGLYDLSGNVSEWCSDWFAEYQRCAVLDPAGEPTGTLRVLRGGNWFRGARLCRVTSRAAFPPDRRFLALGFRLALGVGAITGNQPAADSGQRKKVGGPDTDGAPPGQPPVARGPATRTGPPVGPVAGRDWAVPEVGLQMVWVPPGTFQPAVNHYDGDWQPVRRVRVSRGYWLGQYEVTQAEFRVFAQTTAYLTTAEKDGHTDVAVETTEPERPNWRWEQQGSWKTEFVGDRRPVVCVSWDDAVAFCRWLTAKELGAGRLPAGYEYRLPIEAEWEYAARGGSKSRGHPYSGSDTIDTVAWYGGNSDGGTHVAGTKQPNELGVYDLSGNVYEWGYDRHTTQWDIELRRSPWGEYRMLRGGSWRVVAWYCRPRSGSWSYPGHNCTDTGFRLALGPQQ